MRSHGLTHLWPNPNSGPTGLIPKIRYIRTSHLFHWHLGSPRHCLQLPRFILQHLKSSNTWNQEERPTRNQPCPHLAIGLLDPRVWEKNCCSGHPVCGVSSWWLLLFTHCLTQVLSTSALLPFEAGFFFLGRQAERLFISIPELHLPHASSPDSFIQFWESKQSPGTVAVPWESK